MVIATDRINTLQSGDYPAVDAIFRTREFSLMDSCTLVLTMVQNDYGSYSIQ
jgi:hypothetical protein